MNPRIMVRSGYKDAGDNCAVLPSEELERESSSTSIQQKMTIYVIRKDAV
jgi:hypothetical protein